MRRIIFSTLGVLEILVAAVLIFLIYLSTRTDVGDAFTKAERVTRRASNQVRLVQVQVENLHGPEMRELAQRLQEQTRLLTAALQAKDLDFDTLSTLSDAVGDMATGLEGLANSFQAAQIDKLGSGLGETANFLEKVIPTSTQSAADLEKKATAMQADARRLQLLLKQMQEIAAALRQGQKVLDNLSASWPALRVAMLRSATLLKTTRGHLHGFLENRRQLEEARQQAVELGESFATMVPLLSEQLEGQLQEQDRGLVDLRESIDEVGDLLPAYGRTMGRLFQVGRLLAWLVAAIICLHGAYLLLSARIGRRYSM